MKSKIVTFLILVMVISVSVLGLAMVNHTMEHDNSNCAASIIMGMKCPKETLAMVQHHIAVVREFSMTIIPQILIILSLFLSVTVFSKLLRYLIHLQALKSSPFYFGKEARNLFSFDELHHWLSRFELSPSFAITAR